MDRFASNQVIVLWRCTLVCMKFFTTLRDQIIISFQAEILYTAVELFWLD